MVEFIIALGVSWCKLRFIYKEKKLFLNIYLKTIMLKNDFKTKNLNKMCILEIKNVSRAWRNKIIRHKIHDATPK